MKKLFIFQDNQDSYRDELECAYKGVADNKAKLDLSSLSVDYLIDNEIGVLIANGLPKEWYFTLKGLRIVTIVLGDRKKYHHYSDIVVDYLSDDDKRYFIGKGCSVCQNENFNIDGIVNLVSKKEWDSNFFGYNIAYLSCMHLTENIIHQIDKFIETEDIRLIEYLCNCHERRSVRIAEENGFNFTDIRLTYKKSLNERESVALDGLIFKKAVEKDILRLRVICRDFYKDSRYYFDSHFDVEKTREFYQRWVEKGVRGEYDHECFCFYDNEVPIAFCTVKYNKQKSVNIGLFGVDRMYQGNGLGEKLLLSVFNMLINKYMAQVFVVTQGRNYGAQRLYQNVGFRTESTQLWYHKWM